ncbi:MAG: ABC transporter permease, partial [Planctomycetota bacterium]
MFAIAWKEYRQIRVTGALVVGTLAVMYFVMWASPWSGYRSGVVMIGVPVLVALLGGMCFSEERRRGTDRFLGGLPVGALRRWLASAGANAFMTAFAVAVVFLLLTVWPGTPEQDLLGDVTRESAPAVLLLFALWSAAVFWSSVVSGGISAMILTLGTAAAVSGLLGWLVSLRWRGFQERLLLGKMDEGLLYLALGVVAATLLAGSYAFERRGVRGMSRARKAAGVTVVFATATLLAAGVFTWTVVDCSLAGWRAMGDVVLGLGWGGPDGSLLVARGDRRSGRLLMGQPDGRWREYAARLGEEVWRLPQGRSGDGKVIAFRGSRYAEGAWETAFETVRALALGARTTGPAYDHSAEPIQFLDLETGEVIAPALPVEPRAQVWPLGWMEKPTRFIAAVDRMERDDEKVVKTELYVIAPDGGLLERRDLPEVGAFRRDFLGKSQRAAARRQGERALVRGPLCRYGSKIVSVRFRNVGETSLSEYEAYGSCMVYDMDTGKSETRTIEDPETHLAYSPSLALEVKLEG